MSYRVKIHTPYLVELAKQCGMPPKALKKFEKELQKLNGDDTPAWDLIGTKLRKIEERLTSERTKDGKPVTIHQVGQWMEMALNWYYRLLSRDYYHVNSEIRLRELSGPNKRYNTTEDGLSKLQDALQTLKGSEWNAHDGIAKFPELYAALKVAALLRCEKPDCGLRCDCAETSHWCESSEELTERLAKDKEKP